MNELSFNYCMQNDLRMYMRLADSIYDSFKYIYVYLSIYPVYLSLSLSLSIYQSIYIYRISGGPNACFCQHT
jgi:hypothetical protein